MRFRKGSKVEVLSKEEIPSGAWRCAEILWGNGHSYDVKYDWSPGSTGSPLTGRVSRKHIRPCPPSVGDSVDWLPGDLVEVLDNISWKIATVLKLMNGNYFLVRLLESSQELRVQKSFLRVRQCWQHDRWVIVGNGSVITEDGKPNNVSTARLYQMSCQIPATVRKAKRCVGDNNLVGCQESNVISSRALKRESPYATSQVEGNTEAGRKFRAVEADGRRQRVVSERPSFQEKGQSWRLASKGLKVLVGFVTFVGSRAQSASKSPLIVSVACAIGIVNFCCSLYFKLNFVIFPVPF